MEQLTSHTGSRLNHLSTPRRRAAARDRAARLGAFEKRATKAAQSAALRVETSKAWPYVVGTALMVLGSVQPK
ncbi:hypothetical protein SEA_ATUIN_329 [Arthrobacter phage Atuin]|nr:hypothetical protein SEA_ATUIN_128 [Arthrobacter phage Atuin]